VLERAGGRGILVNDGPAGALVREVRRVDPVIERSTEIEHPEEEEQQKRKDEREFDQRDAAFIANARPKREWPQGPECGLNPSQISSFLDKSR